MTRISSATTTLLFLTTAAMGCATAPAPERVGHVDIPLTATGAGGAVYHLPAGTTLELFNDSFVGPFSIDGDGASISVDVPPGTYSSVLFSAAGSTTLWPLVRQNADGTTQTVQAMLDPIPDVTVTENQTTPLVIRFHVAGAGPISFTHGSVAVSVTVDEDGGVFQLAIDAPAVTFSGVADGSAPPQLAGRFPANGAVIGYHASAQTTGPFAFTNPGTVCAPATASVTVATPSAQLQDYVTEATSPDDTRICIDQFAPGNVSLVIQLLRFGTPVTPLLSDLTSQEIVADLDIEAVLNADVFDGTTLRPGALLGTQSAGMFLSGGLFVPTPDGSEFNEWFQITGFGNGTSDFTTL